MRNKKITYIKSNSISEAKKFARKIGVKAFYDNIDLEVANICNQCLTDAFNMFPEIKKYIKVIGNGQMINKELENALKPIIHKEIFIKTNIPENEIPKRIDKEIKKYVHEMDVTARGMIYPVKKPNNKIEKTILKYIGIYLDSEKMNNSLAVKKEYDEYVESGFAPKGLKNKGIKAIIDHEIGHIIDWCYNVHKNEDIKKIFKYSDTTKEVSEYAAENIHEFIAECWTEYNNSAQPRKVAVCLGNIILELQYNASK